MAKEKKKKTSALVIAIAFILGLILGYAISETIQTPEEVKEFETGENILQNSGFENEIEGEPAYWYKAYIAADNLTITWDNDIAYTGERSVSINNTHIYDEKVCNNWAQTINTVPIGRIVELSGYAKTTDAESVVMVIQCWDKDSNMVGFATTQSDGNISGTTEWTKYNTSLTIPEETQSIIIRLVLTGTGQVWFDDVSLVVI